MDRSICLIIMVFGGVSSFCIVDGFHHYFPCVSRACFRCAVERSKSLMLTKLASASKFTELTTNVSRSILYVGNLDWNVGTVEWDSRIRSLLLKSIELVHNDYFSIEFRNATSRQRDIGKHHGGSMLVTFPNFSAAANAMSILLRLQNEAINKLSGDTEIWLIPLKIQFHIPPKSSSSLLKEMSDEELAELEERRRLRAASYARRRVRLANTTDIVISQLNSAVSNSWWNLNIIKDNVLDQGNKIPVLHADVLDWSLAPSLIDPAQGGGLRILSNRTEVDMQDGTCFDIQSDRALRKRAAVEAFLVIVQNGLIGSEPERSSMAHHIVADLGCGAGNLALPLSWWLNHCSENYSNASYRVLGVDLNKISLRRLYDRARLLAKNNSDALVETLEMDLLGLATVVDRSDSPLKNCSAVVSLHACGAASDLAIDAAVRHGLPFAVSPCCIGKVLNLRLGIDENSIHVMPKVATLPHTSPTQRGSAPNGTICYPRSEWLRNVVSPESYRLLASAADYGVRTRCTTGVDVQEWERWRRSRQAKKIIEIDRLQWAFEQGYYVRILELPRIGPLYSKREVLLGAVYGSPASFRLAKLPISNC